MAQIFISYSRSDRSRTRKLIPLLREVYGVENVWWDENFYGGQVWWEEIRQQIARCDVFVYLMSPRSLGSPYCQAELEEARRLHKPILPVKFVRRTRVPDILARLHWVKLDGGVNRATIPPLLRSINNHAGREPVTQPPVTDTPVSLPDVPPRDSRNYLADYAAQIVTAIIATIIGGVILAVLIQADRFAPDDPTSAAGVGTAFLPSVTPTLSGFQRVQTAEAAQAQAVETQSALDELATANSIRDANATGTAARLQATETAAQATLRALSATANATPDPIVLARTPVSRNDDWTPVEREFDLPGGGTVTMVLVPAGCFMMGSEAGESDEQPVHEQCFDEPFWIDKYEVTNEQYGSSGYWSGDDLPRERVNWFDARDFCESRGGRLPTEAEWEYAARGPDGLVYPWGDEFVAEYVVYSSNSGGETAAVGSGERAGGRSWVGAHDLSGNVWEWVSSLYEEYPYGDNHESNTDTINRRVLRGGSFGGGTNNLRSAYRYGVNPAVDDGNNGFRCARS